MPKNLVDELDKTLHQIFRAMNLDRIPMQRENGNFSAKNLSLMEIRILRVVDEHENIPLKEIRVAVDIPNSTLTSIIKKFETKGLITKSVDSFDKRSYLLSITPKGHMINTAHRHFDRLIAQKFLERVGNDELMERFVKETQTALAAPFFTMEEFCTYYNGISEKMQDRN